MKRCKNSAYKDDRVMFLCYMTNCPNKAKTASTMPDTEDNKTLYMYELQTMRHTLDTLYFIK